MAASTKLSCPLCQVRFRLSDVLQNDIPMAQIENIEEDDDSSVLPPLEEESKRKVKRAQRTKLQNPSSPRWKLSASRSEANHTKGSTDGTLLSKTGDQVFANDFPYSAKAKEESLQKERQQKERKSRFPKKRLGSKPVSERPFGRLKTSTKKPSQDQGQEAVDSTIPMIPLHQPLPIKEKHTVLKPGEVVQKSTNPESKTNPVSQGRHQSSSDGSQPTGQEQIHSIEGVPSNAEHQLLAPSSPQRARRSSKSSRSPWIDLGIMVGCCLISLPLAQLGLWWVVKIDPLGVAPMVREAVPVVVPAEDHFE